MNQMLIYGLCLLGIPLMTLAEVPFVDMRAAVLKATEGGKRWAEFHFNADNCHPTNKGHVVWAETVLATIRESLKWL